MPDAPLLEARKITKRFPGVLALDEVSLTLQRGEVHALAGENGAGKSTLMHILSGSLAPDAGEILLDGNPVYFRGPREAEHLGIGIIHQELSLVPNLSVAENIFLGRAPQNGLGLIDWKRMHLYAEALLKPMGLNIDVRARVSTYPMGVQQMVEIAKALSVNASVLIMDEPTSSLTESEAEQLFVIMERLRDEGRALVYISHRMEDINRICDRVTVLRDGRWVGSEPTATLTRDRMIHWMVGREVESFYTRDPVEPGHRVLEAENITLPDPQGPHPAVDDVSLSLRAGEIVGLAGLLGAGTSELLGALFGRYGRRCRGAIRIRGEVRPIRCPKDAIRSGLALLTNDRKASGLVMPLSVTRNMTLASLWRAASGGFLTNDSERSLAAPYREALNIKVPSMDSEVWTLSGGNQQKVILAKWLLTEPEVILLDEPTRGIDVGAKAEIYRLMNEWTRMGRAILLITSELPELLAMSDRILVMAKGKLTAELSREEATPEKVMAAAV